MCGTNPFRVQKDADYYPRVETTLGLKLANAFGVILR
jgi:hypothetical protein